MQKLLVSVLILLLLSFNSWCLSVVGKQLNLYSNWAGKEYPRGFAWKIIDNGKEYIVVETIDNNAIAIIEVKKGDK